MRSSSLSALVLVTASVATVCISGCTSKPQTSAAPPSTSASPSGAAPSAAGTQQTPETQESATQHAIHAYIAMQNAFLAASQKGDPAHPDLARYATGDALALYTDALNRQKAQGLLGRGQSIYHPKVTQLSPPAAPTKVSLEDCMDTSATSLYKANGDPYQDTPGGRRLAFADVERLNGIWKVTSLAIRGVGSCTG